MSTIVTYDGTDIGRIYLKDIGQRNQLGGGKGIYTHGQDQYISSGEDATLVSTGDVLMSVASGVLKTYSDAGSLTIS